MSVWYPCIYCTEDLKCTKNSDDGVISFCVLGPCHDETPSNADRIRAMTDEELAEFLYRYADYRCPEGGECGNGCQKCWLEWLRQEARDET